MKLGELRLGMIPCIPSRRGGLACATCCRRLRTEDVSRRFKPIISTLMVNRTKPGGRPDRRLHAHRAGPGTANPCAGWVGLPSRSATALYADCSRHPGPDPRHLAGPGGRALQPWRSSRDARGRAQATPHRFLVMTADEPAAAAVHHPVHEANAIFRVRNLPPRSEALGSFVDVIAAVQARSYMENAPSPAAQLRRSRAGAEDMALAFDELKFFSGLVEILGVYP